MDYKIQKYGLSSDESELSWLEPELELKDFQLGSARLVVFSPSARNRKSAKNEPKFDSQLKTYFWLTFTINLFWKWLNYVAKSQYSTS